MIPAEIDELMSRHRGEILRKDSAPALAELAALGISDTSQAGEFFLRYKVSSISSTSSNEELMDLLSPTPQMRRVTEFVREVYEVPSRFVCLTSAEGEGFYLYDRDTEAVYDVGVQEVSALTAGSVRPRWIDFFTFMEWYLQ